MVAVFELILYAAYVVSLLLFRSRVNVLSWCVFHLSIEIIQAYAGGLSGLAAYFSFWNIIDLTAIGLQISYVALDDEKQ
jgi:hypothetical protein